MKNRADDYPPDPELGAFMRGKGIGSPLEDVTAEHPVETAVRFGLGRSRRVVELSCGHVVTAKRRKGPRMRCPRCQAMIDEGRDFVSFRYLDRGLPVP